MKTVGRLYFPRSSKPFSKMPALALQPFVSAISTSSPIRSIRFKTLAYLKPIHSPPQKSSSLLSDTLRLLEWDKVCDSVASFAGTSLGREATKVQLWSMNVSYDESMSLLAETNAAVEMMKYGISGTDFSGLDVFQVKSATERASRGLAVDGVEAMAVAGLLQFADILQSSMKAALKEDTDWYNRFMPLSEMVMQLVINRPLVKSVQQVIDEDGSVKDSASSDLKRARDQVHMLERKLYQLMDNLIRSELNETSSLEVSNIDGRLCIKSGSKQSTPFKGLLLSSGSGVESLVEPISAVPLNDELQRARALVGKAEVDVLSKLTAKMQAHLDDIRNLLNSVIHLDVVTARAKYSLAFGGTYPELSVTRDKGRTSIRKGDTSRSTTFSMPSLPYPNQKEWTLYLRNAYHPLLLQQHRENLQKAKKDVSNATAEIRRRKLQRESMTSKENLDAHLTSLEIRVNQLQDARPVPVDFLISTKTRVLVITGPNTGGKTISLKTVGLAALMAKSGIYVLASEPVKIPWFDSIFADIGDEQSLAQSLSTFSGHLKQIIAIKAQSTSKSLVLLDEVGAGTNPLEGAALGMSILEGFAETGALLTIATTHHGELKTLKYSNDTFENACVEFDEVNLKPTYKILWGVPGRSNAINIAERLGLPQIVLDKARELYGTASAEINEVIVDMERFKQEFLQQTHEAQDYLTRSRELHEKLLAANQRITEHIVTQRYRKNQEISQAAAVARSNLHHKLRQFRASETQPSQNKKGDNMTDNGAYSVKYSQQSPQEKQIKIPEVGDRVHVSSLRKKATVLKVEASKGEIVVQAGNMQLRLKLSDIEAQ